MPLIIRWENHERFVAIALSMERKEGVDKPIPFESYSRKLKRGKND